jgi:hypothetical protein
MNALNVGRINWLQHVLTQRRVITQRTVYANDRIQLILQFLNLAILFKISENFIGSATYRASKDIEDRISARSGRSITSSGIKRR